MYNVKIMKQRQHYVPQFYLKHFANKSKKVHVLNMRDGNIFTAGTKNVGHKKALYGNEDVEEDISAKEYNRIVSKLEKEENLTNGENSTLNAFLNNFIKRRPEFESIVRDENKMILDVARHHLLLIRHAKENGAKKVTIDGKIHDIRKLSMKSIEKALSEDVEQAKQKMNEMSSSKENFKQSVQNKNNVFRWIEKRNYFVARSKGCFVTSNFFGGHDIFPISSSVYLFNKELHNEDLLGDAFRDFEKALKNCQNEEIINCVNKMIANNFPHGNTTGKDRRFEIYAKEKKLLQIIQSDRSVMDHFK